MMRRLLAIVGIIALWPATATAQRLDLSITPSSFSFPSADPDTTPVVLSPVLTIRYRVQQNAGAQWRITVLANGDLVSGPAAIPIASVSWIASPSPPFQEGTLSSTVEQLVASGTDNVNPARTGSITFRLVNLWTYPAGVYSQSFVFTISAP